MSHSQPSSDTEEQQSSPTCQLKEGANGTPVTDDQCPNLDDEVSAARGVDLAIPQKREREASLEPPTPHPDDTAHEPVLQDNRSESPVKKSRALSTPAEADENDNEEEDDFVDALEDAAPIPSPRPSPPHERKSQGVDDIAGSDAQKAPQDSSDTAPAPTVPDNAPPPDAQAQIGISSPTHTTTNPESQNQPDVVQVSATGEVDAKVPTGGPSPPASVEPATTPLPVTVSSITVTEKVEVPVTTSAKPISQPEALRPHEIDDQNHPHSHAVDTFANSNAKRPSPPLSEVDGATKRPREDEDGNLDPNPREAKRASPPPDKEKEKEKEKKERPMRKKSGSDAHALSAPTSPRSKPTSVFGGGGFLAYASTESPFAAVKGPSLFGSSATLSKSSVTTPSNTPTTPTMTANSAPSLTITSSLPTSPPKTVPNSPVQRAASPTPAKRTGFEAFASAASPFASAAARARSPVRRSGSPGPGTGARSNPFALYAAGGTQSLFSASGAPAAKRARGDSESNAPGECSESSSWREGSVGDEKTFGERLRAGSGSGGDEEDEADGGTGVWGDGAASGKWAEQEVMTGEEDDETIHSVRGKLFILSEQNQWKERGTGILRLNRRRADHNGARLVMRKDAVYVVLLNVTLFRGMSCTIAQDPRYLRFSVLTHGRAMHYNLRLGSAQAAADLLKAINDNIPHA